MLYLCKIEILSLWSNHLMEIPFFKITTDVLQEDTLDTFFILMGGFPNNHTNSVDRLIKKSVHIMNNLPRYAKNHTSISSLKYDL